jgi:two-component system response regulator RegA
MSAPGEFVTSGANAVLTATLAKVTWEHIQRVLFDCGGNISEAARRLGITRRTLQLKLKKDPPRN